MKKKSAKTQGNATVTDDYLDLIRRFPLRPIRTDAEYDQAIPILEELVARADSGLTGGERDYADGLAHFVRAFDDKHFPVDNSLKTPLARLQYLMDQREMSIVELGRILGGGRGHASLILQGKHELSKANILVLANCFKISPAAFL